jgi:hypothetical protein
MFSLFGSKKESAPIADVDIDSLVNDHVAFNRFVYTPVHKAIKELKTRTRNAELAILAEKIAGGPLPDSLNDSFKAVLFRQIATPNHEIRRFLSIVDALDELEPFFGEHRDDRFTTSNEYKVSWGKVRFDKKLKQNGKYESLNILDFPAADGKKISEVTTLWGQLLIDFHHGLFKETYRPVNENFFHNISPWLQEHGGNAANYYKPVLTWFLQKGLLFENFVINDGKELSFTRNVFLPAFIEIYKETGFKPLVINLLPTAIEGGEFWLCHPHKSQTYVEQMLKSGVVE